MKSLTDFIDPIRPYLYLVYIAIVLGVLGFVAYQADQHGRHAQGKIDAKALTKAAADLNAANTSLNAAGAILRDVSAETRRRVERDRLAAIETKKAATIAEDARVAAQRRANDYKRQLDVARKTPDCKLLLSTDVRKVCGL